MTSTAYPRTIKSHLTKGVDVKNIFYVYAHRRQTDGKIFYIGKGKGKRAWATDRNASWREEAQKHGVEIEFIAENLSEEEAFNKEIETIQNIGLENLTNMANGGEGSSGWLHTEESKNKISIWLKGNQHLKGHKHSEDAKKKMSETHKARYQDPKVRERQSQSMKGREITKEHREKLRAANKGKRPSEACRSAVAEANRKRIWTQAQTDKRNATLAAKREA